MRATELLEAARTARRAGDLPECILQASAAASAAEQEHDAETEYHAHACVGRLLVSRDEPDEALSWLRWALDAAMRGGLSRWLGPANHDLALAVRDTGNYRGFSERSGVAFLLYRDSNPKHPGISGLVADMAETESEQNPSDKDRLAHALQAWRAVPGSMSQPRYRLNAAANGMRSAALLGLRSRYLDSVDRLEHVFATLPHHEHAARTLVDAAAAAVHMRDFERAASLAGRARGIAEGRGEGKIAERASEALNASLGEREMVA